MPNYCGAITEQYTFFRCWGSAPKMVRRMSLSGSTRQTALP